MQLTNFRYDTSGKWFKGNTHIHSTASDGGKTLEEITELYSGAEYDFLCATDHWVCSDLAAESDKHPLLWLDGIELNGQDNRGASYHVVGLGKFEGITRELPFHDALESLREQGGLTILAHPYWMGNSFEDALEWDFDGVEIYNHVCHWLNGKSCGGPYWNHMLKTNPTTLSFCADDAHLRNEHPLWNGGWIVANTSELSAEAIMAAIRSGNYYSSCGPNFESIVLAEGQVSIKMSPTKFVRVVGPGCHGMRIPAPEGEVLTETTFELPDWPYVYVEIENETGQRAWTNTLMGPEKGK